MSDELVGSLDQAIENIHRYRSELRDEPRLTDRIKQVHAWYAIRSNDEQWIFAPSKFVGYARNTAREHLSKHKTRNGGQTETVLRNWFETVAPETRRGRELGMALRDFLATYGHSHPRQGARICIPRQESDDEADPDVQNRIHVDATICGGRPHIRGTRVRVSDILDMLANGVRESDILADYPYLTEADLRAALAFAAAASAHRILSVT